MLYSNEMSTTMAIVLAAGKGSRFDSDLPKVLHPVHEKPMVHHVIDAILESNIDPICLVVGHQKDLVKSACNNYELMYATQEKQLGTGHALQCAIPEIKRVMPTQCIVLAGDCPLIQSNTISTLIDIHQSTNASATLLTAKLADAGAYGRIIRNQNTKKIIAIKEAADCSNEELKVNEFNSGIYCFNTSHLMTTIQQLSTKNNQKEYYLTDIIALFHNEQLTISGHCIENAMEVSGANTTEELKILENYC